MAELVCVWCDQPFTGPRNKKYCSAKCSNAAGYRRRTDDGNPAQAAAVQRYREKRKADQSVLACDACGQPWQRRLRVDIRRRFCFDCSPPNDQQSSQQISKEVPHPSTEARRQRSRRVNAAQAQIRRALKGSAGKRPLVSHICLECSSAFISASQQDIYCSKACGRRASKRDAKTRRRHRTSSGRVPRRRVFERDGWICQLCGEPVDRSVSVPHPLAATLDHIVPLSLGGIHDASNCQCAHFECNWKKGDHLAPPERSMLLHPSGAGLALLAKGLDPARLMASKGWHTPRR